MSASSAMATAARSVWTRFLGSTVNVKVAKLYTQMDSLVLQMHSAVVVLLRTSHAHASLVTKIQTALDSTALVSNWNTVSLHSTRHLIVCKCSKQTSLGLRWWELCCMLPLQISMSVSLQVMFVMIMPSVWTLMEALAVLVTRGSLAMELTVVSSVLCSDIPLKDL